MRAMRVLSAVDLLSVPKEGADNWALEIDRPKIRRRLVSCKLVLKKGQPPKV